jgi:hypothetical protein
MIKRDSIDDCLCGVSNPQNLVSVAMHAIGGLQHEERAWETA